MKKIILEVILLVIVVGIIILINIHNKNKTNNSDFYKEDSINKNSIEYTGWLKTKGAELQNQRGEKIQLRGISSHGLQWYSELVTYENLKELKENWNINVFRIAMYTSPDEDGYIAHPEESKELVRKIVNYAIDLDLYVIIDWHILKDNDPLIYKDESIKFFDEMSKEYADTPNVLYEICNEPNGKFVTWADKVKPYAEELIKTIRKNSPKSLIIIGTPNWCTDIKSAADDPIMAPNIVYACHFYAGSHKQLLRDDIDYCISKNIPIFISECGITNSTGRGKIYEDSFNEWNKYINEKGLSWIFWSLGNKPESSSIIKPEYKPYIEENDELDSTKKAVDFNEYLTETGEIIKGLLQKSY